MKFLAQVAQAFLWTCRATSSTPGATERDCPFLLPGYVADVDMEFALKIIHEGKKGDEGKIPLAAAIIAYWEAPHPG